MIAPFIGWRYVSFLMFISKFRCKTLPTIYLHIGFNKTGTTSIQKYFYDNKNILLKSGILYPDVGLINSAHYGISTSVGFYNNPIRSDWSFDLKRLRKNLCDEITKDIHSIILSSEDFILDRDFKSLRYFLKGFSTKIIVYLRRHDYWWMSAYAQAVKMKVNPPWGLGIQSYINFNKKNNISYGNYRYLVERWASEFGEENIIIRPYENLQNSPNIAFDFLSCVSELKNLDDFPIMAINKNVSLPSRAIQFLDIIQRMDVDVSVRKKLIWHVCNDTYSNHQNLSLLSGKVRCNIIDENMDDYNFLARKYLKRDNGLFFDALPDLGDDNIQGWPSNIEVAEMVAKTFCRDI